MDRTMEWMDVYTNAHSNLGALLRVYYLANVAPNPNADVSIGLDQHQAIEAMIVDLMTEIDDAVHELYYRVGGKIPGNAAAPVTNAEVAQA